MVPLVLFTSNHQVMGSFVNNRMINILAWATTAVILGLNVALLYQTLAG
jgi:manganese transport protein